jgi:3-hydroxy acid dehydrogenase/malonic semialdehyde reductase
VPDMAAYTASKAGIRAFSDILRADLAETGIRVTEILPGLTKTNIILKRHRGDHALEQEYFERFKIALDPEDVARSVLFALNQPAHVQIAQLFILPVNRW